MTTNLRVSKLDPLLLQRLRVELARAGYTTRQAVYEALTNWVEEHETKPLEKKMGKPR